MKDNPGDWTLTTCPQMIQSISYVHDDGELPIRGVRSVWTCARGNRVCYGVCAAMVGMFFSLLLFFYIISSNWECKGRNFWRNYKIFYCFSMKITIFSAKNPSESQFSIPHVWTEPFLIRNFPMAFAISSTRSPPFR